ncbi:class I SAM-dependent methyltransferase (plasmid) [Deltaproteobacteria bacterium Smac51]|nr:class I SAM-dependent methyltransferase [Deltaproteobacteria bacterium Smac51]
MKHGDFTNLAANYAKYRPGYAPLVLEAIGGLLPEAARAADVGAGTGLWSRMLHKAGMRVTAVEPNEAMRRQGQELLPHLTWADGSAEATGLDSGLYDLVTMASSFHWPDFNSAVKEFERLLKPGAYFAALWNTRDITGDPLLEDIEAKIYELTPGMKRVSSGRSEFCDGLTSRLESSGVFSDVLYLEGHHVELQTPEHYLGLWESVNDIRVQAGEDNFAVFLNYVREKTNGLPHIAARYKTRCWLARKGG